MMCRNHFLKKKRKSCWLSPWNIFLAICSGIACICSWYFSIYIPHDVRWCEEKGKEIKRERERERESSGVLIYQFYIMILDMPAKVICCPLGQGTLVATYSWFWFYAPLLILAVLMLVLIFSLTIYTLKSEESSLQRSIYLFRYTSEIQKGRHGYNASKRAKLRSRHCKNWWRWSLKERRYQFFSLSLDPWTISSFSVSFSLLIQGFFHFIVAPFFSFLHVLFSPLQEIWCLRVHTSLQLLLGLEFYLLHGPWLSWVGLQDLFLF